MNDLYIHIHAFLFINTSIINQINGVNNEGIFCLFLILTNINQCFLLFNMEF